jgi:hypothetical protein
VASATTTASATISASSGSWLGRVEQWVACHLGDTSACTGDISPTSSTMNNPLYKGDKTG